MDDNAPDTRDVRRGLQELQRQVVAMGNMAESLFAQCVVALVERTVGPMGELRQEDYRAHERRLEIDRLCFDLLSSGELDREQVRFVSAAGKIATDLKRAADESLRIAEAIRACDSERLAEAEFPQSISRMATLTQSMLSDVLEAFINRDSAEAGALHLVFREVSSLAGGAVEELTGGMTDGKITVPAGVALVGVVRGLKRVGDDVLDISNQVSHLYRRQ